jgi:hypothetical protein
MLDIDSIDEIFFIKPKKFTDIKKFTCSGKDLETILIIKDKAEPKKIFDYLSKNFKDPVSMLTNLEYLNLIDVSTKNNSLNLQKDNKTLKQKNNQGTDLKDILFFIETKLLESIGPIANVVVDDAIEDMGELKKTFPNKRIPELINILSKEIPRDDKRNEFQKAMMLKLKELKMA